MAKFVCDIDQVMSQGDKLADTANNMKSEINQYSSNVENDTASWEGIAKNSFSEQCTKQVKISTKNADEAAKLAEFIKKAAQSIQELEEELASQDI